MKPFLGMIFTVREISYVSKFGPVWSVDPTNRTPMSVTPENNGHRRVAPGEPIIECADAILTPLDGGDLSDTALAKIIKEIEHA